MKKRVANKSMVSEEQRDKQSKSSVRMNRKKTTITVPREHYLTLLNLSRKLVEFFEQQKGPKTIEQEPIKQETIERGHHQPGLGWTYMDHFVPVVSEDWNRKYQRRKEIIRKGTWNSSSKGWEYDGDFASIWADDE